jgi:hypothetical protein
MNFIERMEFLPSKTDLKRNFYYLRDAGSRWHFWMMNYPPSAMSLSYHAALMALR